MIKINNSTSIPKEIVLQIQSSITAVIQEKGYLDASKLPGILRACGIDNYKEYAISLEDFVNKYLADSFVVEKGVVIGEKTLPCIISPRDGKETVSPSMSRLKSALVSEIEKRGFYLSSALPSLLRSCGISDYKSMAKSLTEFIEVQLGDQFVVRKNANIEGKIYPNVILLRDSDTVNASSNDNAIELTDNMLAEIEKRIQGIICSNGYLLTSVFPEILASFGINDYKKFAPTIIEFINKYLKNEYQIKTRFKVSDKVYPSVIVFNDSIDNGDNESTVAEEPQQTLQSIPEKLTLLSELFQNQKYEDILSMEIYKEESPYSLSPQILEFALLSAQKILEIESPNSLNLFQTELISERTIYDFSKKWKKNRQYHEDIISAIVASSVVKFEIPNDIGHIVGLLKDLEQNTKPNNSYSSIASRFECCYDSLAPAFYVCRAYSNSSQNNLERCVSDYCNYLKNLKLKSPHLCGYINIDKQLEIFCNFLHLPLVKDALSKSEKNLKSNIISVFIDLRSCNNLRNAIDIISVGAPTVEVELLDLCYNYAQWNESKVEYLFNNNVSLLLFEKICAVVWDNTHFNKEDNFEITDLISWILKYWSPGVVDEIVRYTYSKQFTKLQKQTELIAKFSSLVAQLEERPELFNVCAYIKNISVGAHLEDVDEQTIQTLENWDNLSQTHFEHRVSEFGEITTENSERFLELFSEFSLDEIKKSQLHRIYTNWYSSHVDYTNYSEEEFREAINYLSTKGLYDTVIFLFEFATDNAMMTNYSDNLSYADALYGTRAYGRLVQFVISENRFSDSDRDNILCKAIIAHTTSFGLSQSVMLMFNEQFTVEDAIGVLSRNFNFNNLNNAALIISLIILYAKNDELLKSVYLYTIFQSHFEIGYTRLYSQFRTQYSKHISRLHSHYDVIEKAFYVLPPSELLSFLEWASCITIPSYCNPSHAFDFFFKEITKTPNNIDVWKRFSSHLYKKKDEFECNRWLLCVCFSLMKCLSPVPVSLNIKPIYSNAIKLDSSEQIPLNYLFLICSYIIETDDEDACEELDGVISNEKIKVQITAHNPWRKQQSSDLAAFLEYCTRKMQETSSVVYFNLLKALKINLSGEELIELSRFSANKVFLLQKLCNNYLSGSEKESSITLLTSDIWHDLSYQERELYRVASMLYEDNDSLISKYPKLFDCDTQVDRIKKDCALIVRNFPNVRDFTMFEESCNNLKHKLAVYSFVFGIYYDEDIYKRYDAILEENLRDVYVLFLKTCFEAQLIYNKTYELFYRQWRYLFLLIINVYENKDSIQDTEILELLNNDTSFDDLCPVYTEFKKALSSFLIIKDLNWNETRDVLFSLIVSNFSICFTHGAPLFVKMHQESRELLKKLISYVNFRRINQSTYAFYAKELDSKSEEIKVVTLSISNAIFDLFDALINSTNRTEDESIVNDFNRESSDGHFVGSILSYDSNKFAAKANILIPLLCSRQLPHKIMGVIRASIIRPGKIKYCEHFEDIAVYLSKTTYPEASHQMEYLQILRYCVDGKNDVAKNILSNRTSSFVEKLPLEWVPEANALLTHLEENREVSFVPATSISFGNSTSVKVSRRKDVSFVEKLSKEYEINSLSTTNELIAAIRTFRDDTQDIQERIRLGIALLLSYKNHSNRIETLPARNELIVDVALLLTDKKSAFIADFKMLVLAEVIDYVKPQQINVIAEHFKNIQRLISLESWLTYSEIIQVIVAPIQSDGTTKEIRRICKEILTACPDILLKNKYSNEELYEKISGFTLTGETQYAIIIRDAIERRKHQIEDDKRLIVSIENAEINDSYVYFSVRNIGSQNVNISSDCELILSIRCQGDVFPPEKVFADNINELRAGWITGCRKNIATILKKYQLGDRLFARIEVFINGTLASVAEKELIIGNYEKLQCPPIKPYYVSRGVGDSHRVLFGRTQEQTELMSVLLSGKAVIYGASRMGKTSLLNWLRSTYANEKGNVITVLMGGELGPGRRDKEYESYFYSDTDVPVPYGEDNHKVSEYLLIDSIKYGLLDGTDDRISISGGITDSDKLIKEVLRIIEESSSIYKRYVQINRLLKSSGCELWLLFDEFQKVVEKWEGIDDSSSIEFIDVCNYINEDSSIKLVFCGSDELLHQMALKNKSVWRERILDPDYGVFVGPIRESHGESALEDDPFKTMIQQDDAVTSPGIVYSKAALDALCVYSARVPLFAKEICNTVLVSITNDLQSFQRRTIYSYDISVATQKLVGEQKDTSARIRKIFNAVTKGLDENSDIQYLLLMANWFLKHVGEARFAYDCFMRNEYTGFEIRDLLLGEDTLRNSLKILLLRGIIKGNKETGYEFATVFFYNAFCGRKDEFRPEKLYVPEDVDDSGEPQDDPYSEQNLKAYYKNLGYDPQLQYELIWELLGCSEEEAYDRIAKKIGEGGDTYNLHGGFNNFGGTQTNMVSVNAQTINAAFSTLLNAGSDARAMLEALNNMPTLNSYIRDEGKKAQLALLTSELASCETEEDRIETQARIEQITAEPQQEFLGDTLAAAVSSDEFRTVSEETMMELLKLRDRQQLEKILSVPDEFSMPLNFAIMLHNVFNSIEQNISSKKNMLSANEESKELDYCPVAIMYCKVVEAILKSLHTPIYISKLGRETVKQGGICFADLLDSDGKTILPSKELTIGSFAFHVVSLPEDNNIDDPSSFKAYPKKTKLKTLSGTQDDRSKVYRKWETHSKALGKVLSIRNRSAHEAVPITKENFEWLIKILFEDGELIRMCELAKGDIN